jgi:hypothetical protein
MPTLRLTDEQVLDLVQQLPDAQRDKLFAALLAERRRKWERWSEDAQDGARRAAALRGKNWDTMTEEEKEDFIDDVVHEDRQCNG